MAQQKGFKHTEESKKKMSEARKGKKLSEETKNKISKNHKDNPNKTVFKKGMISWNKGSANSERICVGCEKKFTTLNCYKKKYCTQKCYMSHYVHKHTGTKGIMKPNSGSFKKGQKPWNYLDGRSNNPETRKTIRGQLLSHIIYCSQKGNHPYIPKGFIIHHIDCNPKNNNPNNLQLMPDRLHRILHNKISLRRLGR